MTQLATNFSSTRIRTVSCKKLSILNDLKTSFIKMESPFIDKDYLIRCSQKTLQTNEKGFFLQFANHVAETAGSNWIKNVFGKLTTDRERFRIIYEYAPVKDAVCETLSHVQEIYRKKSAEVAQKRRHQAEELLQKHETSKALILASQSVLRAPPTGENPKIDDGFTLAYSVWTRATILMNLKKFSLALADIQAATKEGLPDNLKPEVFCKMAVCYKGQGENNRAKISFALAERLVEGNSNKLKQIKGCQTLDYKEDKKINRRVLPTVVGNKHPDFPNATIKIAVNEEQGKGKYAVTKEDVKTGDTLVVEAPYAACLLPDSFSTHCHHCFDRLEAPVGCPDCASVAFCKAECRDLALSTYHKYECHFLDLLIGSGMSILCHTALRTITQTSLKACLEGYRDRSKDKIYRLCANPNLRPPEDFFQRTIMAAFLLRCLQKSGYFADGEANENVIPNEEEFCVGELLLFHLQMLQFNAHEIYETKYSPEHRFRTAKFGYIGVAVYPTVALFNHDCYPAVTRHFVGKNIVITATRPLSPGEVVAENYGPIFTRKPLTLRQKSLSSRYWFQCKCEACKQDWPSYDKGLEKVSKRLRCPNEKCTNIFTLPITSENLTCPRCKKKISLTEIILQMRNIENQFIQAAEAVEAQQPDKAIILLCQAIDTFHKISTPPNAEMHIGQELLRTCLADSGNSYECLVKL